MDDFSKVFDLPSPGQQIRVIGGDHIGRTLTVDCVRFNRVICDLGDGNFQALDPRDVVIVETRAQRAARIYEEVRHAN